MAKVNSFLCVGYLLSALQQTFSMLYRILGLQDYSYFVLFMLQVD